MKSTRYYEDRGALKVYVEQLIMGIREICIPMTISDKKEDLDFIDEQAKRICCGTLLVTNDHIYNDGKRYYQRIIFRKNRSSDARLLRDRMQKWPKKINDHRVVGRLLGYSKEAIESFVDAVKRGRKERAIRKIR